MARILNCDAAEKGGEQMADTTHSSVAPVQKVVVVDGSAEVLGMLEAVLDAGRYDMVFVESSNHAYSQIRKIVPNLVILCAGMEQPGGFQLLTMLKLDAETREIPVLTYTLAGEGSDMDGALSQPADDEEELVAVRPALSMN
jgi:two-component system phosphate regulon response regulator PhoB